MKPFLIVTMLVFSIFSSIFGQKTPSPVKWNFELIKISDVDYEILATATMEKSWVIYSQFTADGGPIPTSFVVNGKAVGFTEKSKMITEFDSIFEIEVKKFKESAVFSSKVKKEGESVKGYVTFMTCDGSRCLAPVDVDFDLKY